jgi:prevent-host-death family protein
MQRTLSELCSLPDGELLKIVEEDPILVTQNGEPLYVVQSIDSYESMVRRLRQFENPSRRQPLKGPGNLVILRP